MTTQRIIQHRQWSLRPWMLVPVLALSAGFLLMPMPKLERVGNALSDLLHAPCFAILAAIVYMTVTRAFDRRGALIAAGCWIALVGFGFLTEFAQGLVGRNVNIGDAMANVIGVTAGIAIVASYHSLRKRPRWLLRSAGLVLIVAGIARPALTLIDVYWAWQTFPQLANFEWPLDTWRWHPHQALLTRSDERATKGRYSARLDLLPARYPGATLRLPARDWTEYETLLLDIIRPEPIGNSGDLADLQPLSVTIKIQDRHHNGQFADRFHHQLELQPGQYTVRIPISEIAAAPRNRYMDLREIRWLEVFGNQVKHPTTIYIDNIRLE